MPPPTAAYANITDGNTALAMKTDKASVRKLLKALGFTAGAGSAFAKEYAAGCVIAVDLDKGEINYGGKIQVGDRGVANFSQPENLVVLECTNRLLEKGYMPRHLHLQKRWRLGCGSSGGVADIAVADHGKKTLLLIEFKTADTEFEKEKARMKRDGGQLFTYFQQDKDARFLCLYASESRGAKVNYH